MYVRLKRLRLSVGMYRKTQGNQIAVHDNMLRQAIQQQLESGQSRLYGRMFTYHHIRRQGINTSRDRVAKILKELDPGGHQTRAFAQQRLPRGVYTVPGPGRVLSVDGHHKMSMYGIEVYGGIDAYSRYVVTFLFLVILNLYQCRFIPWIYVGISARTAVAVLRMYLDMIQETGFLPEAIRSDRGTETPMMANAHWQMHRAVSGDVDVPLKEVYWYGTSTLNQRIESWWRHLSKSLTLAWKKMLDGMNDDGSFTGAYEDQIALLFIYMPLIRQHVYDFVELWNVHPIRAQRNRPYLPTGKPIVNYHCPPPGVVVYGKPVDQDLLKVLQKDVAAWGIYIFYFT